MKTLKLILAFTLFINFSTFAQDDEFYTILESVLSEDEKTVVSDAKETIEKGDTYIAKAETEDEATAKLFSSSKKRKQKKAEKKSLEGKQLRIKAAGFYDKGYQAIFDLYMEKLNSAEYEFSEDGSQSQKYIDDGNTLFADAQRTLKIYVDYSDDDLEETVKYTTLKSDLKSMKTSEEEALQMIVDAIKLWQSQTEKKSKEDFEDEQAWTSASKSNTISAYKSYIASYPTGLHVDEANDKIDALEEAYYAEQQAKSTKTTVYKVQLLCDSKKWTDAEIKSKKYFGTETIEYRYVKDDEKGCVHKYSIGNFTTYKEAKALKQKCGVARAFVVCFIDGVQVEITKELQGQ